MARLLNVVGFHSSPLGRLFPCTLVGAAVVGRKGVVAGNVGGSEIVVSVEKFGWWEVVGVVVENCRWREVVAVAGNVAKEGSGGGVRKCWQEGNGGGGRKMLTGEEIWCW